MPEFIPEHASPPGHNLDAFTVGYLECAEWLARCYWNRDGSERNDSDLTDEERSRCRGFTRKAIAEAKADCKAFQKANRGDLATYYEISNRDKSHAGHDFFLSRNGHGAGFFDRGSDPVFHRLQDAARVWSGREAILHRSRLIWE
jgi:hypothetical protein